MHRLRTLIQELQSNFPNDSYLKQHDLKIRRSHVLRSIHNSYERALSTLDPEAWEALRQKAFNNFTSLESVRGKQVFFDHLNEAFAYRQLLRSGCLAVEFVAVTEKQEKKGLQVPSPDLRFTRDGLERYCEVKTINVSDAQLARDKSSGVFNGDIYFELNENFISKLTDTISKAIKKFNAFGETGLVYLLIHSDDRAFDYLDIYKRQVEDLVRDKFRWRRP